MSELKADYTAQEIVDFCRGNRIDFLRLRECSMCNVPIGFVIETDRIGWQGGCDCADSGYVEEREISDLQQNLTMNSSTTEHIIKHGKPSMSTEMMARLIKQVELNARSS